jgi:IS1 family transposase
MLIVDRETSCVLGWAVDRARGEDILQQMVDAAPPARLYYSDLLATYRRLIYTPGIYTPMPDRSQTFRVEGDNAELRYYLARLARRSRCFSRCIEALREAIKLFVYAWNSRQLYKSRYPNYPAHVMEFCMNSIFPTPDILQSGKG